MGVQNPSKVECAQGISAVKAISIVKARGRGYMLFTPVIEIRRCRN